MEYKILIMATFNAIIFYVNQEIEMGWEPQGGIFIDDEGNYLQALIKR